MVFCIGVFERVLIMKKQIAYAGAFLLAGFLVSQFQCSVKKDIEDAIKRAQEGNSARRECALNPESCPAPSP